MDWLWSGFEWLPVALAIVQLVVTLGVIVVAILSRG